MTAPAPDFDAAREAYETAQLTYEQIQSLDADEKAGMLFYLTGFLAKSPEFQDALTRAYNAQIRIRR